MRVYKPAPRWAIIKKYGVDDAWARSFEYCEKLAEDTPLSDIECFVALTLGGSSIVLDDCVLTVTEPTVIEGAELEAAKHEFSWWVRELDRAAVLHPWLGARLACPVEVRIAKLLQICR